MISVVSHALRKHESLPKATVLSLPATMMAWGLRMEVWEPLRISRKANSR
jgi:hypothetical protein